MRILQSLFTVAGPVAPKLMSKLMYKLWFTSPRYKKPAREQLVANKAEKSTLMVNDQPIRLWSWGEGATILFIHGWAGRGTQVTNFVESLVAENYRVVSFDAPAHGETPGKRTDIFEIANALSAVIEKIGPVYGVITHSLGAMAYTLAYNNFHDINRVVFISPPATVESMVANFQRMLHIPDAPAERFLQALKQNYGDDIFDRLSIFNNVDKLRQQTLIIHGHKR